jgi:serine/threonine-protein kinase
MAAPRSVDRQTFLAYLRQSGLLTDAQLARVALKHAAQPRGRVIARALVEDGWLTRFQAERLLVGQTSGFILGQYRVLDELGRGGMGRVFKAEHRTMRRVVALKVLAPELLTTDRAIDLFLHEVRAYSHLVHPNVVTAYDANEANGRYYLVLEYVDGPNLDQLVRRQGRLSVGLACDYVRQVALGLEAAHQLGMVHRDIKPANILVQQRGLNGDDSPGLVKVSDFGLARLAQPASDDPDAPPLTIVTKDHTVMGTPDYLSPEQARCLHRTDIRSDLYSLGCTFYFLLTGQVPFPGGNQLDKMIRHATEAPQPLSAFRDDVPRAVAAIVDRLMAKQPDQRFQTPAELAEALEPFAVGAPTPWVRPGSNPLLDSHPDGDLVSRSDGDLASLGSTVANDQSPTPALPPLAPIRRMKRPTQPVNRLAVAVITSLSVLALTAIGVVIALLAAR